MTAKYYIYRNLHTGGFSIKHRGLVIDRGDSFVAESVTFKVNEKGRQRVLDQGRKGVHAYAVADKYKFNDSIKIDNLCEITYNPYKFPFFTAAGSSIHSASTIAFKNGKCYLIE